VTSEEIMILPARSFLTHVLCVDYAVDRRSLGDVIFLSIVKGLT